MTSIVNTATKISLAIQTVTGIIGGYGLTIPLAPKDAILKEILNIELLVQVIEYFYYISYLSVYNVVELTQKRYYDWFLSTPMMLFTISVYFFYVNFIEEKDNEPINLAEFAQNNVMQIVGIVVLNFLMLLFGLFAELGMMSRKLAFGLGTGALCGSFGIIYENYAKFSEQTKKVFWLMFGLWSMYGIAFLFASIPKNLMYTVLDIFSKNFFGIFLFYIIQTKAI